jgi:hypothetical protein
MRVMTVSNFTSHHRPTLVNVVNIVAKLLNIRGDYSVRFKQGYHFDNNNNDNNNNEWIGDLRTQGRVTATYETYGNGSHYAEPEITAIEIEPPSVGCSLGTELIIEKNEREEGFFKMTSTGETRNYVYFEMGSGTVGIDRVIGINLFYTTLHEFFHIQQFEEDPWFFKRKDVEDDCISRVEHFTNWYPSMVDILVEKSIRSLRSEDKSISNVASRVANKVMSAYNNVVHEAV